MNFYTEVLFEKEIEIINIFSDEKESSLMIIECISGFEIYLILKYARNFSTLKMYATFS